MARALNVTKKIVISYRYSYILIKVTSYRYCYIFKKVTSSRYSVTFFKRQYFVATHPPLNYEQLFEICGQKFFVKSALF